MTVHILGHGGAGTAWSISPRSSSGQGHRPLKAEISGSNPLRGTPPAACATEERE